MYADTLPDNQTPSLNSSENVQVISSFGQLDLKEDLLKGVYAAGCMRPTRVQQRAIVPIISGRDVIAQAQIGTGKTVAFCIPLLQSIDPSVHETQALVLSPTREGAFQISLILAMLGEYTKIECHACLGGNSSVYDMRELDYGMQIVSGTPERILNMIRRGNFRTKNIKIFVLDEADALLATQSKHLVHDIHRSLPPTPQVVAVGTTLPHDVLEMTTKLMIDPIKILLKRDELISDEIKQFFVTVKEEGKFDILSNLYGTIIASQAVIFCNTGHKVDWLTEKLRAASFIVSAMHGGMPQQERDGVMHDFRRGVSRVLITTDLWARSIDVGHVTVVVNYDLPSNRENYIQRAGRSGRYGRKGVVINFVTVEEVKILREIEQYYAILMDEMPADAAQLS